MTRSLIVHMGLPKTGSTSIQMAIRRLTRALRKRGIHTPTAGRSRIGDHNNLAYAATGARTFRPALGGWPELRREVRRCTAPRILLSAETFANRWHRGSLARLIELRDAERLAVTVHAYVRPQWQQIEARYSQVTKTGSQFDDFAAYAARTLDDGRLDYNVLLSPWRDAFGDGLRVHPLEPSRLPHGLVAHFFAELGEADLALASPVRRIRANRRVGARHLAVCRETARLLAHLAPDERGARLARLRPLLPLVFGADAPFAGLAPDQAAAVMAHFAAANARLARDYGIDADGVLFRDPLPAGGRRPNRPDWGDLGCRERWIAGLCVRGAAGATLDAPRPSAATAARWLLRAAAEHCRPAPRARTAPPRPTGGRLRAAASVRR